MSRRWLARAAAWLAAGHLVVAAPAARPAKAAALAECPGGPPVIVLDVGHGLDEPGAISARGKPEFAFNLALAHSLAAALTRAGAWPKLINDRGARISLAERVRLIEQAKPQVVLSIHHDSVQPQYLERWVHQGRSLDFSDRFAGFSLFVSRRAPAAAASERLAGKLGEALVSRGLTPSLHHAEPIPGENRPLLDARHGVLAFDGLAVLKGSRVPAVLIEAGIIKNPAEEAVVETPRFRTRFAEAVVEAIAAWCKGAAPG
jgi:N-acetylmuramoyl-L-alanine amidase